MMLINQNKSGFVQKKKKKKVNTSKSNLIFCLFNFFSVMRFKFLSIRIVMDDIKDGIYNLDKLPNSKN
jgi:hypothetical protein